MHNFIVSVAEILARPGEYRDFEVRDRLDAAQTSLARLSDEGVTARLRAESVVEGILFTGRVSSDATLECARCLEPFQETLTAEVCELAYSPGHATEEDAYRVMGTDVDLEPMIRDVMVLALPLNPVCSESCKGLCAGCGADLNETVCTCTTDETDPRWAELDELRARLEAN